MGRGPGRGEAHQGGRGGHCIAAMTSLAWHEYICRVATDTLSCKISFTGPHITEKVCIKRDKAVFTKTGTVVACK